jgi:hypothetical protein
MTLPRAVISAGGGDLRRFLGQEEARQVEVVDHHVPEQAAGDPDVVQRRRRGVAAGDYHLFDPADLARLHRVPQCLVGGVVAPVEADLDRHPAGLDLGPAAVDPGDIQIDRLLAEHRLAGLGRLGHEIHVGVGGRRDQHRLHGRVSQHGAHVRSHFGTVLRGRRFGRRPMDVVNVEQGRVRVLGQVVGVHLADPAGPEECEIHHWLAP